ncbi:hypothetical protein JVU11DRAFT_9842 [Chiua virens]|nr:hypothetical protein JVU11DRAFT_9842 [Chiua virens]
MQYKDFWPKIVQCYRVQIDGWLSDVTFANLSDSSRSLSELDSLLRKWKNGTIHWRKLTNEEYTRLENDHNEQIESGDITVPKRQTRSDAGMKQRSYGGHTHASKKARTTSHAVIQSSDDENSVTSTNGNANGTAPSPSSVESPTPNLPSPASVMSSISQANSSSGTAVPSPSGVMSSTSNSAGTAATPSSSTATTAVTAGTGSNFNDFLNMDGDATGRFNDIYTGYNNLNSFFDFDFSDGTALTMTF